MEGQDPNDPDPTPPAAPAPGVSRDLVEHVADVVRQEPLLWPVALVMFLVVCTFGAAILTSALRLRGLISGAAMLVLIFLTVWGFDADIRERRLRPQSLLALLLWLGSGLAALALSRLGAL